MIYEVKSSAQKILLETDEHKLEKLEMDFAKAELLEIKSARIFPKEIELNNSFYDIKKIEVRSGKFIVYCYNDTREKKMKEELRSRQSAKSKQSKDAFEKKIQQDYLVQIPFGHIEFYSCQFFVPASVKKYSSYITEKISPPPNTFI